MIDPPIGVRPQQRRRVASGDLDFGDVAGQVPIEVDIAVVGHRNRNAVDIQRNLAARAESAHHDSRFIAVSGKVLDRHSGQIVERLGGIDQIQVGDLGLIDPDGHGRRFRKVRRDINLHFAEIERSPWTLTDDLIDSLGQLRQRTREIRVGWRLRQCAGSRDFQVRIRRGEGIDGGAQGFRVAAPGGYGIGSGGQAGEAVLKILQRSFPLDGRILLCCQREGSGQQTQHTKDRFHGSFSLLTGATRPCG